VVEMNLTLQEWTNLAEILGSLAIILSLVFVGRQISDTTKERRSGTAYNATVALQAWYNEVGTNAQAATVFRKGMIDPTSLTEDERLQFIMCIHSASLGYQSVFFLGTEGTLDAALYKAMAATMEGSVTTPGFAWYWQQRSGYFTAEFRGFVDQIIKTQPKGRAEIYN
jgi:hypothetical protein